jgi:hypothetical protein
VGIGVTDAGITVGDGGPVGVGVVDAGLTVGEGGVSIGTSIADGGAD